jgi:hypothetical protein
VCCKLELRAYCTGFKSGTPQIQQPAALRSAHFSLLYMAAPDRAYTLLLSSLGTRRPESIKTPLPTVQALIIHYLANVTPSPTPLAATIVSSPVFHPLSHSELELLSTSFRHATHSKLQALKAESSGLFSPSLDTQLNVWSLAVLQGLEGGHPIIRLACCSGLLLGLEDALQHLPAKERDVKSIVEDELVMTFADVIDQFSTSDSWGKEFGSAAESGVCLEQSISNYFANMNHPHYSRCSCIVTHHCIPFPSLGAF